MTTTPEEGISQYNIPLPPPFGLLFFISCYGWSFSVALVVVDMCWFFFFHLGLLILHMLFTPGYIVFFLGDPTHPPCKGFALMQIALHWKVGGRWVVLVLVGPTSPRTIRSTQQTTYPPTHTHLPIPTQPPYKVSATTCIAEKWKRSPRLFLEHSKHRRTTDAVA